MAGELLEGTHILGWSFADKIADRSILPALREPRLDDLHDRLRLLRVLHVGLREALDTGMREQPLAAGERVPVGGMRLAFAMVTVMAVLLVLVVARLPSGAARPAASARAPRLISRSALPVSFALVLSTIGHSSVFAFLPLYALGRGETAALAWFFAIYPAWLITWRALLRGVSDRLGHFRVGLFAMSVVAVAYLIIALPPTPLSLALAALVVVIGSTLIGAVADRYSYAAGFAVGGAFAAMGVGALALGIRRGAAVARYVGSPNSDVIRAEAASADMSASVGRRS